MSTILTDTAAAALLALSEADGVTLSEAARAAELPVSSVQRAVNSLADAGIVERDRPRGLLRLADDAPVRALRELAQWQLGADRAASIAKRLRAARPDGANLPPATIRNPAIRKAWPDVIAAIVERAHPIRIVLFGSQARGDARPDSDLDLLVVVDPPVDKLAMRLAIRRAMSSASFGKDIIVASQAEALSPALGTVLADAVRTGVAVYER